MSHFCTIVLVPSKTEYYTTIPGYVNDVMGPYQEQLKVDEYETDCYCIGTEARHLAIDRVSKEIGDLENERTVFRNQSDKSSKKSWTEIIATRIALEKKYEAEHPSYNLPYEKCDNCNGTGKYKTQDNPNSKWDWYQIGGRWNGSLKKGYEPENDPDNMETCNLCKGTGKRDDSIGRQAREDNPEYTCNGCDGKGIKAKWPTEWADKGGNIEPVASIPDDFFPYSILTPDGEWMQKGDMGWWGISKNDKGDGEWENICKETFKKYSDGYLAVVVDCHI